MPKVNIALHKNAGYMIKDGQIQEGFKILNPNEKDKFTLTKDINNFTLFLSNGETGDLIMREPTIIYDTNSFKALFSGQLNKGGILNNTPQTLEIDFSCTALKQSMTDFELTFVFANNEMINLYISKECNTAGEAQQYFNILYTVYWIFLLLITIFCVSVIYYYVRRNEVSLYAFYYKTFDQLSKWITKGKYQAPEQMRLNNTNINEQHDTSYEECDLVDVKIKTEMKEINPDKNFKNFTNDYGGI